MQKHPDGRPENRTCSISEAEQYRGTPDVYFALNAFKWWGRRTENLAELTCLFVDVDCYKAGLTYHEALQAIKWDYVLTGLIPEPSIIVDSGRGLWLIWLLHPTPKKALPLWQAIESHLVKTLEPLGADPKCRDVTRIARLPGSINSKSNTVVRWETLNSEPYRLDELQSYLPKKRKKPKRKNRASKSTISTHPKLFSLYTLHGAIIEDLKRLADIRGRSLRGHRDYFLFIWCNCLAQMGYAPESSKHEIRNVALEYLGADPLTDREWAQKPKSIRKRTDGCNGVGYRLSNEWIIKNLAITQEEQKQMQTLISQAEKRRRNKGKRYNQNREQYLSQFDSQHQRVLDAIQQNPDSTIREIARLAGCSVGLAYKLKKTVTQGQMPAQESEPLKPAPPPANPKRNVTMQDTSCTFTLDNGVPDTETAIHWVKQMLTEGRQYEIVQLCHQVGLHGQNGRGYDAVKHIQNGDFTIDDWVQKIYQISQKTESLKPP